MGNLSLTLDGASLESCHLDCAEAASAAAQDRYEARLVAEARAMVAGSSDQAPTVEHLRVVLDWLDGAQPRRSALDEAPF